MIFITVGTHEQGLDRLLIEMDKLIEENKIKDEVFAQVGYSSYKPRNYKYETLIGYEEMDALVKQSDIVITHGGPGSIFHAIQYGKVPIVVPRNPKFNEHVDNHQILFTKRLEKNLKVIGVYNINDLEINVKNYNDLVDKCKIEESNSRLFIKRFSMLINAKLRIGS